MGQTYLENQYNACPETNQNMKGLMSSLSCKVKMKSYNGKVDLSSFPLSSQFK